MNQLGVVQQKIEHIHQRESDEYVTNFGKIVVEYVQTIFSVRVSSDTFEQTKKNENSQKKKKKKFVLSVRMQSYKHYKSALEKLEKKKEKLDKAMGNLQKGDEISAVVQVRFSLLSTFN